MKPTSEMKSNGGQEFLNHFLTYPTEVQQALDCSGCPMPNFQLQLWKKNRVTQTDGSNRAMTLRPWIFRCIQEGRTGLYFFKRPSCICENKSELSLELWQVFRGENPGLSPESLPRTSFVQVDSRGFDFIKTTTNLFLLNASWCKTRSSLQGLVRDSPGRFRPFAPAECRFSSGRCAVLSGSSDVRLTR